MSAAINLDPLPATAFVRVAFVQQTNQGTLALTQSCPFVNRMAKDFGGKPDDTTQAKSQSGDVLSWNPPGHGPGQGHWELRPSGTVGAYEQERVNGNCVSYNPTQSENGFAVFAYLPNA